MNILFIHQSFPGQYRHIVRALSAYANYKIVAMGIGPAGESLPPNVTYIPYGVSRGNTEGIHDWLLDIDSKFIRAEACATACIALRGQGFNPDIICAHPGWGEALFLKDVWPSSRLLCYQEFYYLSRGFDLDFDSEIEGQLDWQSTARLRFKNINPLLTLELSDWNVTPTQFQKSTFPSVFHHSFSVIHDGIDTALASPASKKRSLTLPDAFKVNPDDVVLTFVNRTIEPYRGCHTFFRSVPYIHSRNSKVHVVIVGSTSGVSYGKLPDSGESWTDVMLKEIESTYDPDRLHIIGSLDYQAYIQLLQLSSCHVYLTYPFVLSWSLLEAMSIGCPVVASATSPVEEVISHESNGMLVDFFSFRNLADTCLEVLASQTLSSRLGLNARSSIVDKYSLEKCVPRHLDLIHLVASSSLSCS